MSEFCHITLWISGGVAVLCLLLLPFWLLGIPGHEGSYADGWMMGLVTVCACPIAWLCVLISWLIARKLVSAENLPVLEWWIGVSCILILTIVITRIVSAFREM